MTVTDAIDLFRTISVIVQNHGYAFGSVALGVAGYMVRVLHRISNPSVDGNGTHVRLTKFLHEIYLHMGEQEVRWKQQDRENAEIKDGLAELTALVRQSRSTAAGAGPMSANNPG